VLRLQNHHEEGEKMAAKKSSSKSSSTKSKGREREEREERDDRDDRRDDRDRDSRSGRSNRGSDNSDRVRLTGLWESKRRGLYTGGVQDLDALKDLIERVQDEGGQLRIALFENDARSKRDAQFTVYASIGEERQSRGGGRSSYGSRDRGRDRDDRIDDRDRGRNRDDDF
jgi:hypothetical protein